MKNVINRYVNEENASARPRKKYIFGISERTFYLTLIVFGIALIGFFLVYNLHLNGNITGFFTLDGEGNSQSFVDSLTRSSLENLEFDWAPSESCEGVLCHLSYIKISGVINAEKSGSASIYLVDGERKLKILGKDFELESVTTEEVVTGSETTEEVCNTKSQEVCHDEKTENETTQVCETQDIQVCENVTVPGQETTQNVTTEEPEVYSFDEECDETCALSGFDKTSYKISVELDDGITAEITSISYQWAREEVAEEPSEPLISKENESIPIEPLLNETLVNETGNFNWETTILNNYGNESKEINVKIKMPLSLKNSTDEIDNLNVVKKDKKGKGEKIALSAEDNNKLKKAKEKIKNFTKNKYGEVYFSPEGSAIKDINFINLVVENDTISLGISGFNDPQYVQTYAIDPTQVNFTEATVTAIAKGNELYKCKDWNFTKQTCFGNWTKVMDITPGQEYSFILTAEDPGFAETIQPNATTGKDVFLWENNAAKNYGASTYIGVDNENGKREKGLLWFNLSNISSSATINSAVLELYQTANAGSAFNVVVYRINNSWNEGTADGTVNSGTINGTTWNERWYGTNWDTTGGDYNGIAYSNVSIDTTINAWKSWDITALVQGWVNGSWTNNGLILLPEGSSVNNEKQFASSDNTNSSIWPKLTINYTTIDTSPPVISLVAPANDYTETNTLNVTFTYNVTSDLNITNCTFYLIEPDGYVNEYTNTTITKGINQTFKTVFSYNGQFQWNINCTDSLNNISASSTRNITIDMVGAQAQSNSNITKDSYLVGNSVNTNYGSAVILDVDAETSKQERTVIELNLSKITSDSQINSAILQLYLSSVKNTVTLNVSVYRLTNNWTESGVTWNNRTATAAWTTAGGDYGNTTVFAMVPVNLSARFYEWNITSLVQGWVNGSWPNYGLIMIASGATGNNVKSFASSNNGNASRLPVLIVNYTTQINDTTPPSAVSNLANKSAGTTWVYWNWTNPSDSDLNNTIIYLDGINVVNLTSPINYYNATGLLSGVNYTLRINTKDITGNVNYTNTSSTARTVSIPVTVINESSSNSTGATINTMLVLIAENGTTVYNDTNLTHTSITLQSGYYTIIIQPINYSVYQVVMSNVYIGSNTSKIVDFDSFNAANTSKAFAINPYVNFSSANVTLTAAGIELMKCLNWSFATQTCEDGNWVYVMDLIVGQNYSFLMNSTDPGFVEMTRYGCTAITCWNKGGIVACTCAQVGSDDGTLASGGALSGDGGSWAAVLTEHINSTTPAGKNVTAVNAGINWYIDQLASSTCSLRVYKNTTATWYEFNTTCQTVDTMYNYNLSNWINTTQDAQNVKLLINMTGAAGAPNEKLYVDMINVTLTWADITPPVISLNSPAPGYLTNNNSLIFNWSVYDNLALNSTCNLTIDSVVNKSDVFILNGSSTAQQVNGIAEGLHNWNVSCIDDGGNNPVTSATRNFTIDTIAPVITVYSPQSITYGTKEILVNFTADSYQALWFNNGTTNISYTNPASVNVSSEGSYTFIFYANDSLGNLNSTNRTFNVDITYPIVTINSPLNALYYNNKTVLVNISATNGLAGIDKTWYNWNGTNVTYTNPINVTFNEGVNTLNAYANDSIGRIGYSSVVFTIDTAPPSISIVSPENTTYNNATQLVNISASDVNLQTIWFFNGTANVPYTIPTYVTFAEGSNTLIAYANDSVGNLNWTQVIFFVDSCVPNMTNTTWSDWINLTCSGDYMNQSRFIVEYDLNDCGEIENVTYYEYNLTGPTYANTTWNDWYNISVCYPNGTIEQQQNLTQYDIYGCAANQTFFEDRIENCSPDLTPPTITSTTIEPYDPAIGENVSIYADADDNVNVSGVFANITLSNGTIETLSLPANYTIQIVGRHNITIWANDTSGNIATLEDYFIAATNRVNVTFRVIDSNSSGVPVNLSVYFTGTDKEVHEHDFIGNMSDEYGNLIFDLYYVIVDENSSVRLNGVNVSSDNNDTLGFDRNSSISEYLTVYGLSSTYVFDNGVLELSYSGLSFSDEGNLVLEKCDNWDFIARTCLGTWNDITSQSVQDLIGHTFTTTVTSFSGFGIREVTPTTPVTPTGGVGGGCLTNWTCSNWGVCISGTQIRNCSRINYYCYAGTKPIESQACVIPVGEISEMPKGEIENALKILREFGYSYLWIIFLLIAIEILLLLILVRRRKLKKLIKSVKLAFGEEKLRKVEHLVQAQRAAEFEHSLALKFRRILRNFAGGIKMLVLGIGGAVGHLVKGVFELVSSSVHGFGAMLISIGHQVIYVVSGFVELLRSFAYGAKSAIVSLFYEAEHEAVLNERRFVRRLRNAITNFVSFAAHGLKMFLISMLHGAVGIFEAIMGLVNSVNDGIRKMLVRIARGITSFVIGVLSLVISLVKGVALEEESISMKVRNFFASLVSLIEHDARLAERRYARRIIRGEHDLVSRFGSIVREFVEEFVKYVQSFIYEAKRTFRYTYLRIEMLFKHEEMRPHKEEPSEDVLPGGFDFDEKGVIALNAKKIKLEQYIKKLDVEYKHGTLDTKGYLKTRENLLTELWKLKH